MKKLILTMAVSGALLGWQQAAMALGTALPAGTTANPIPSDSYNGSLLATSSSSYGPTGGGASISGTVWSWVYSGDTFNTLGGLTFVYQISNNSGSAGVVEHLTVNDYIGAVKAYVAYSPSGIGLPIVPTSADRGAIGTPIEWNFSQSGLGTIPAGSNSRYLIVQTDAQAYSLEPAGVIDGTTANVSLYGPNLPDGGATIALMGLALAGLAGVRRMF